MASLSTPRKSRKPARETHGKAFISTGNLTIEQALDRGELLLTLHTDRCVNYLVQRLSDPDGETVGFRMMKLTDLIIDRKLYDIDVCCGKDWLCDCPDAQFQNRECKHVRALRSALAANGITIAAPKNQEPARKPVQPERAISGALVGELLSMRIGEVRHVHGHRCERFASAILIDECPAMSPRQMAECLAQSEPCKRPAPANGNEFETL